MKGQEPVRSLFNVATIEYIICAEDFMLSSGDFHNEWYLDRLLGKVKIGWVKLYFMSMFVYLQLIEQACKKSHKDKDKVKDKNIRSNLVI